MRLQPERSTIAASTIARKRDRTKRSQTLTKGDLECLGTAGFCLEDSTMKGLETRVSEPEVNHICHLESRRLRLLLLPQFPGKVVKNAQLIAVQIGDPELAQVPGFVLGLSEDFCPGIFPPGEEFIHFLLAVEIEPDHHRPSRAVVLVEGRIGQKHPAVTLGDATDAALVVAPVEM